LTKISIEGFFPHYLYKYILVIKSWFGSS
jgi:hypothetical protein